MMKRKELTGDSAKPDSFENHVLRNALGPVLVLVAAPTSAGNQLPNHGDIGAFGTNLYLNVSGTTYRITMTAV